MTTTRFIMAGVLGGIAMFAWTSIAHMATPLRHAGIHNGLPNQENVLAALQTGLGDNGGLYLFPGSGAGDNPSPEQEKEGRAHYAEKLAANPSGLLLYRPTGAWSPTFPKLLTVEFATELLEALLAVFLLTQTRIASFSGRVGFVFVAGILASIATNVSYWNWYGFPSVYIACYMLIEVVGFLCVGLVAGLVMQGQKSEG
jgi:hypothetical protein